jgi:hypothetical protein
MKSSSCHPALMPCSYIRLSCFVPSMGSEKIGADSRASQQVLVHVFEANCGGSNRAYAFPRLLKVGKPRVRSVPARAPSK